MTNYGAYSDEALVELYNKGDTNAQDYLMQKYKETVKTKAKQFFLTGGSEDDIIQEGMIGLFKAIRDYEQSKNTSFKSFAMLCITRQVKTAVTTSARQKHMPLNNYVSLEKPIFDDTSNIQLGDTLQSKTDNDPQDLFVLQEDKKSMEKVIDKSLSDLEKRILSLYLDGLNHDEIADKIGKSYKSVDNALQRIKKKLTRNTDDKKIN